MAQPAGDHHRRDELVKRSRRAVQWLQPGLVVKRWVLTSALGLVMALLGAAIWADLKPIYWTITAIETLLRSLAGAGQGFTGPLVLLASRLQVWELCLPKRVCSLKPRTPSHRH